MTFDLDAFLDEELPVLDAVDLAVGESGRPSEVDIWLYQLEDAAATAVVKGAGKKPLYSGLYEPGVLYAHHFCLTTAEDVRLAPDRVLFEALRLDGGAYGLGWLQFISRELGRHSKLAAGWGLPVLVIPEGATYDAAMKEQRQALAAAYFVQIMRELRGRDVLEEWREFARRFSSKFEGMHGQPLPPERLADWLKGRSYFLRCLLTFGGKPDPASVLSAPGKLAYGAVEAADLLGRIREAAARRRVAWGVAWSCDCAGRRAELEEREGRAEEEAGVGHALRCDAYTHRGDDIGVAPAGEEVPRLVRHFEEWTSSPYHIRNAYLHDRLEIFLARNERARELLRLPDNRALAAQVKREVRWLYLPGWTFAEGGGPSHMAGG